MSDEQRVRTMAGWIGVEISRSRVRTPGKAGYGLYRVRGSEATGQTRIGHGTLYAFRETDWTAYAFTLEDIEQAVKRSISRGMPAGPWGLLLHDRRAAGSAAGFPHTIPTRWTQAYRGRRDLGTWMQRPGLCGRPYRHEDGCLCLADGRPRWLTDDSLGADLEELGRTDPVVGEASARLDETVREIAGRSTVRSRQRAENAAFQAEHLKARAHGLVARYAAKRARGSGTTQRGATEPSEGF